MSKKILAVDDSESVLDAVSFALKGEGFEVITAVDGVDALAKARGLELDLVLTDINMPNMDGLELVKVLRADPGFCFVPIVLLTTESEVFKKIKAKNAGATAWIVKPFKPEELFAVINKVLA